MTYFNSRLQRQTNNQPLTPVEMMAGGSRSMSGAASSANIAGLAQPGPLKQYDAEAQLQEAQSRYEDIQSRISSKRLKDAVDQANQQAQNQMDRSNQRWQNAQGQYNYSGKPPSMFSSLKNPSIDFMAFAKAISGQESGGDYGATNPSGATGRYQILRSNFEGAGGWDKEALGRDVSYEQFLKHPHIQDAIAMYHLQQLYNSNGLKGAAAAWYSGGTDWHNDSPQNGGPSIHDYVMSVMHRANKIAPRLAKRLGAEATMPPSGHFTGLRGMVDPLKGKGDWIFGPEGDYGVRTIGQGFHTGVDLNGAPAGTPIYAAQSGRISKAGWDDGYGNQIFINGKGSTRTMYGHMQGFAPGISKGDFVHAGQLIGYLGGTGSYAEGDHLHFETWKHGHTVNPERFYHPYHRKSKPRNRGGG